MAIVAASIKFGNVITFVPPPGRHHTILHNLAPGGLVFDHDADAYAPVQGFIDHTGYFHSRYSVMAHALAAGQRINRSPGVGYHGPELFSEDLW